jgi:hypothetical protein
VWWCGGVVMWSWGGVERRKEKFSTNKKINNSNFVFAWNGFIFEKLLTNNLSEVAGSIARIKLA